MLDLTERTRVNDSQYLQMRGIFYTQRQIKKCIENMKQHEMRN
jgi:hypothetical protein